MSAVNTMRQAQVARGTATERERERERERETERRLERKKTSVYGCAALREHPHAAESKEWHSAVMSRYWHTRREPLGGGVRVMFALSLSWRRINARIKRFLYLTIL